MPAAVVERAVGATVPIAGVPVGLGKNITKTTAPPARLLLRELNIN